MLDRTLYSFVGFSTGVLGFIEYEFCDWLKMGGKSNVMNKRRIEWSGRLQSTDVY